ncbi:hypothetical protein D3C80_900070 [compost metagenome]
MQLTAEGQLAKGDKIKIVGKSESDSQTITVKEVIDVDGHEEVIINKRKNRYFITNMVLDGTSWAKSVTKLIEKKTMQLTAEGQLAKGDKIKIVGKSESDSQTITVKEVIDVDGHEEVIINKRKNRYFITNMVLDGTSWAKSVTKLIEKKTMQLTAEGQLAKGDKIKIVGKSESDSQTITVKEVIDVDGHEEVIINKRKNRYFITNMVLDGTSWAKSVTKIS